MSTNQYDQSEKIENIRRSISTILPEKCISESAGNAYFESAQNELLNNFNQCVKQKIEDDFGNNIESTAKLLENSKNRMRGKFEKYSSEISKEEKNFDFRSNVFSKKVST